MSSPDIAELRHGANVLRALARNLEPELAATGAPLDHESARDAVTLLGWRGEATSETLQFALGLSQPACVRLVDRLVEAGLLVRRRRPGDRHVWIGLTAKGRRSASGLVAREGKPVEAALREALLRPRGRPGSSPRWTGSPPRSWATPRTPRGSAGPAT